MNLCINPCCDRPETPEDELFCPSCGSEVLLQGRYRVVSRLGQGGFGKTYAIRDMDGTTKVLKVLTKQEPKYIELFQREAMVLSQLNHSGIPKVEPNAYFVVTPKGYSHPLHCLVMEKISGLDFQKYMQQRGKPINQILAVQWLIELIGILQTVHAQNFLHRDIKPSNIMLKADGRLALIDFGTTHTITKVLWSDEDKSVKSLSTRVISALYTPYEQMRGQPVPQSDYFALGRTFVFLLTGQPLDNLYNPLQDQLDWRGAVPDLVNSLADFIDALMHPNPAGRPANAAVMLRQLHEIHQGLQPTSTLIAEAQGNASQNPCPPFVQQGQIPVQISGPSAPPMRTDPHLSKTFIAFCHQTLTEFIGPMAGIVFERALAKNPLQSEQDLVEALANQIPSRQDSQRFRHCMFE